LTLTAFPLAFTLAGSLFNITCFLYILSYYLIWLSNSAWVF
jgi:hypothetical protein